MVAAVKPVTGTKPPAGEPTCRPYCVDRELLARLPDGRERQRCRECGGYVLVTPPPVSPYGIFCAVCTDDIHSLAESALEPLGRDGGFVRVCAECRLLPAGDERYAFDDGGPWTNTWHRKTRRMT